MEIQGRISKSAFQVVSGLTFGISILAAIIRIAIRLRSQKRLHLDDYLLIFSCICLTAATVFLYIGTSALYFLEDVSLNGISATSNGAVSPADILTQILLYQKVNWIYLALTWTNIFCVKLAFLVLFKNLVDRLPTLRMYWKGVVVFTLLVFAFAICDGFIACPKLGLAALQCSGNEAALNKSLAIGATAISLDIMTDVLILAIPVSLVWRVKIKTRQKLGLGTFLCLSIVMIIVAIIRVSGIHYRGTFDNSWIFLWQQVESCAAVTMVSLTAFRSAFIAGASNRARKPVSPWQASIPRVLGKHRKIPSEDQDLANLTIPSATFTGMRTFIQDDHLKTWRSTDGTLHSHEGLNNVC